MKTSLILWAALTALCALPAAAQAPAASAPGGTKPPIFVLNSLDATISVIDANTLTEIRRLPAQYLWVHRRFKTRPPGEPPVY